MSAVAELVKKITGRKREQQATAYGSYRDLIRAALHDEPLDELSAEQILESAGKTLHDLEVDVADAQLRRQKRAEVDELPALQAEIKKCDVVIAGAFQKVRNAKEELDRVRAVEEPKKNALAGKIAARSSYLDDLCNSCDDPAIKDRWRAVANELSGLHATEQEVERQLKVSAAGMPGTPGNTVGSALRAAQLLVSELRQRTAQLERTGGSFYRDAKTDLEKAEASLTALENGPVRQLKERQATVDRRRVELEAESRDLYHRACEV